MADEQGIHPEVMRHIVDLHRKHSELQMQMHDQGGEAQPHEVFQQMLAELKTLNEHLSKLIPAVQADTKADLKEADKGGDSGKPRRERKSPAGAPGETAAEA